MAISTSTGIGIISTTLGVSLTAAVLMVGSAPAESRTDDGADPGTDTGTQVVADEACDALLDRYVEQGVARVTAWGWSSPYVALEDGGVVSDSAEMPLSRAESAPQAAAPQRATSSDTGTNVQEAGVDEPDVVKTDGRLLVRVRDDDLVTYDVTGAEPELLSSLHLDDVDNPEILLVGDRVVVLGHESAAYATKWAPEPEPSGEPRTRVLVVDLADPAAPEVVDEAAYDADLATARQHGDAVRLVLSRGLPDLLFVEPHRWLRGEESALERNREIVRESTIEDWLPGVTRDGEQSGLIDCADVAAEDDDTGLGTLAVVGFDPTEPTTWSGSGLLTDSTLAYFSTNRMYVATSPYSSFWPTPTPCCVDFVPSEGDGTTHLFAFALDGLDTAFLASGEVDGAVADRWSMDEYAGVLRVAVATGFGDANSIVTFRQEGDALVVAGRLDGLGVGESIESMRWFDGLAIMVTFRQVDPLYTIDLTDPSAPTLMGQLKIPGFSEYLHPLGQHRLVGIGQTADPIDSGAQAALFGVSDLTHPRQLDVVRYGPGSQAGAAMDPRQFLWLPAERTVLTVVTKGGTGSVSVLRLAEGRMHERSVDVAYGDEVYDVRLVPLPDDRVVLVTGNDVSSFAL